MGADLVAYSGGKSIGGAQASSILCGQADGALAEGVRHQLPGYLCSRAVAERMMRDGIRGRIITTTSLGAFTGSDRQTHYCAMKAAAHNLMQSLAVVLGPHGITCNSVTPGQANARRAGGCTAGRRGGLNLSRLG